MGCETLPFGHLGGTNIDQPPYSVSEIDRADLRFAWMHSRIFVGKASRLVTKMLPDRPFAELAVLQGSTPLLLGSRTDVACVLSGLQ